jgi:hypothetical protein
MPRYWFAVHDGDRYADPQTMELSDDAAAREYAIRVIRELQRGDGAWAEGQRELHWIKRYRVGWRVATNVRQKTSPSVHVPVSRMRQRRFCSALAATFLRAMIPRGSISLAEETRPPQGLRSARVRYRRIPVGDTMLVRGEMGTKSRKLHFSQSSLRL